MFTSPSSSLKSRPHFLLLKSAAINTVFGVSMTTRRQMLKIKGMSEAKVEKIKEAASKILGSSFATGVEVQDKRKRVHAISTGSKSVDGILGGGIMSQSISEVYGEFRTGKTQLAHTMSVVAQLPPELGGASGKMELINECSMRFAEDKDFRLLIVDSIMALFRVDYSGRGELSERQQKLAQMLSKLTKLSEEYNIAILLTNQVQSDPGATMTFVAGGALKPIGGHILSHASATRLFLRKGRAEERVAKLVDSPDRPESEASYKLDEGGWADVSYESYCDLSRQYDPKPSPAQLPDGTVVPPYTGPGIDTFIKEFGREDLLEYMNHYWVSQGSPNADFWGHEFSKHATCTSTFDIACYGPGYRKNQDVVNYFDAAIRAFHQYPTFDMLAAAGIVPSNATAYTLTQFQTAIESQTGGIPYFGCSNNGTVLTEVWYFSHVFGTEQYGTYKTVASTTKSSCSATGAIRYLERTPSSEREVRK
ncbi:hypothetical protein NLJ89_g4074 [Agrocybe chaxingu]|uniref:ribonuclease T2 n=1 Tax=Agrocybe chaxingu TaxID=84603 RepID=A0A9W8MY73_9AGAR|nr:hypothetical protein NLJ89_g4074 [Agrocybe chaxingu]